MTPEQVSLRLAALNSEETAINQRCRLMTSEQAAERIAEIKADREALLAGRDPFVTIALARIEIEEKIAKHGRIDLGELHTLADVPVPVAIRWLQSGSKADNRAAETYAAANGYKVFTYSTTEPNPLDRARADIMKGADDGTK